MIFKKSVTHLLSYLVSYSLTDKVIHRGAPLLKTDNRYFCAGPGPINGLFYCKKNTNYTLIPSKCYSDIFTNIC